MNRWAEAGYFNILANPVTNPNKSITRAEWAALLGQLFGYTETGAADYKDVAEEAWYYESVLLASSANILTGFNHSFRPNDPVNREEAAVSILRTLGLAGATSDQAQSYPDYREMSTWSRNAIGVSRDKGLLNGTTGGEFQPRRAMSIAEAVTLLDRIAAVIVNEPAKGDQGSTLTYSQDVAGNLFVNASKVKLSHMKVKGDLYIAQSSPDAEIQLEDVQVSGRIYVTGAANVAVDGNVSENQMYIYQAAGQVSVQGPKPSVFTAQSPDSVTFVLTADESSDETPGTPGTVYTPPTQTPPDESDEPILIHVTDRMLEGEDYATDKKKLFDEYDQVLAAPPSSSNPYLPPIDTAASANANTWRTPGASQWVDASVTNLNLNLLRDYKLTEIDLYDGEKYAPSTYTADGSSPYEVMGGTMEVYAGDKKLISYPLTNAGKWVKFDLGEEGVTASSLRFHKIPIDEKYSWWGGSGDPYSKQFTCDVNIVEAALYGIPLGEEPPAEEEWHLSPQEGVTPFDSSKLTFGHFVGTNSFFDVTQSANQAIGFVREYHTWNWTEYSANGQPAGGQLNNSATTPDPVAQYNNTWGAFDSYYQSLKDMGVGVAITFQGGVADSGRDNPRPNWQGDQDPKKASSYLAHGRSFFQHAARYGSNKDLDPDLVKVAPGTDKKIGMDLVEYYENWNEEDLAGYFTGAQFAAMTSADYDGHMGTMGPDVGIKQADPNAKLVLGGLAGIFYNGESAGQGQSTRQFFEDMMKWFDQNRTEDQWKAAHNGSLDGYVRYPFDVINGHYYAGEGVQHPNAENHLTGMSPEEDHIYDRMTDFVKLRDEYLADKEIWLSEFGWDVAQGTQSSATIEYEKNGVTYNPGINTGLDAEEVQARWIVREYLMLAAAGIDRAEQYMMPDAGAAGSRDTRFNTSGLLRADGDNTHQTTQKRPSWYYVGTMKNYLNTTRFDSIVEKGGESGLDGPWVLKFKETASDDGVYGLWLPTALGDEGGANKQDYTLTIPEGMGHAYLVTLEDGVQWGNRTELTIADGKVTVPVTEKPIFVVVSHDDYYKPIPKAIHPVAVNKLTPSNSEPKLMFDMRLEEPQSMTQDQANAAGTYWDPGQGDRYALIDLGSEFDLNSVQLFDGPGSLVHGRVFAAYAADAIGDWSPNYGNETAASVKAQLAGGNWTNVMNYGYLGYLTWATGKTDVKARYLIVGFEDGVNDTPTAPYETDSVPVPEVIVNGSLAKGAEPPVPFVRTFGPKPSAADVDFYRDNEFDELTSGKLNASEAEAAGFSVYGANATVEEGKNGNGETDGKVLNVQGTLQAPQFSFALPDLAGGSYEPDVWYTLDFKFKTEDRFSVPALYLTDGAAGWSPLVTREGDAAFKPIWGGSGQVTHVAAGEWHRLQAKFKIDSGTSNLTYEIAYDDALLQRAETAITDALTHTKPIIIVDAGAGHNGSFELDDVWVYRAKPTNNLVAMDFNRVANGPFAGDRYTIVNPDSHATIIQPAEGEPGYDNGNKVLQADSGKPVFTFGDPDLLAYMKNHGEFVIDYKFRKDSMDAVPNLMLRDSSWRVFGLMREHEYAGGHAYLPYVEDGTLKDHTITPTAGEWHRFVMKVHYTDDHTLVYSAYMDDMAVPVVDAAVITTDNGLASLPLLNMELGSVSGTGSVYLSDVSIYKGTDIINP
ncbi:S-layer homology domain-containing protein [Paenibacillus sp. MWE-103]|uniref:S-layer homology domain-containing protein n=1 Tax=Paenibacillus artemisiicola TaxID=1172618 RepID=A0ABS3WAH7_9BACL|nr:S-layer homology domain-containing protein [Paenibacillus artemisiicola]MBO7745151.1 S-layer homology domain-containing protein [Paenibacillus artemisiicola]